MTRQFLIVIEKAKNNYSAYSPDLPGCVAAGQTRKQAETNMHSAVEMHLQGMVEDREPLPTAVSSAAYVLFPVPRARSHNSKRKPL